MKFWLFRIAYCIISTDDQLLLMLFWSFRTLVERDLAALFARVLHNILHINLAIGIMKAASDFVRQQFSSYFIPIIILIFQLIFLAFWIFVILYLFSSNTGTVTRPFNLPFGWYAWDTTIRNLVVFYLFGLIWFFFIII